MKKFLKQIPYKSKMKAFGFHFAFSLFLFVIAVVWIYVSLYPSIHFSINGGRQGVQLIFAIDLILGPVLTFLIWNPKKGFKEKFLDLSVVGIVQISALLYGMYTVYQQHPVLMQVLQGGSASTISYEQFQDELNEADLSSLDMITSIPAAFYNPSTNKDNYGIVALRDIPYRVINNDKAIRRSLTEEQKEEIGSLEQNHSSTEIYLFELVGRYKKTIILLDEKFQFIGYTTPYEI